MSVLEEALCGHRIVVVFPVGGVEDWVPVAEVLLQEGLSCWAFPPDQLDLFAEVMALYGRRAHLGVAGVMSMEDALAAKRVGARFLLSPFHDQALVEASGVPMLTGALTPTEVAAAARCGAETVLVAPADALGAAYSRALPEFFGQLRLVPWGRLELYLCDMWFEAGAAAAVVADVIVRPEDGAGANDPEAVARRAASFRQLKTT